MTFGQIIKKLRRDADMTQERLAEVLSVSAQAVSRWETDTGMPDVSLLPPLSAKRQTPIPSGAILPKHVKFWSRE